MKSQLASGLNIHRNPLGSRNFEYYSEDSVVAEQMAAAIVRGGIKGARYSEQHGGYEGYINAAFTAYSQVFLLHFL